jgi:endoglucanase
VEGGWFDAGDFVKFAHANGAENFEDIGIPDGAEACPVDGVNRFAAFDRPDARFLDDVQAWPSVEPAIDFTSTGMLAFALAATR